jgi:CheY-like chemotaxis protein
MIHLNGHLRYTTLVIDNETQEVAHLLEILSRMNLNVIQIANGQKAHEFCLASPPELIISDIDSCWDSVEQFYECMRLHHTTQSIPLILTTSELNQDARIRYLEMGIDDLIQKPYYPEEVAAHAEMLLHEIDYIIESNRGLTHGFMGKLEEMNLLDIIQTMELGKKSGVIQLNRGQQQGLIYIDQGRITNAALSDLDADRSLRNMFVWLEGTYRVYLQNPIPQATKEINYEIVRQAAKWISQRKQLTSQMPPLTTVLKAEKINGEYVLSDAERHFLDIFSSPKTILHGIEESTVDDIQAMQTLTSLFAKNLLLRTSAESETANPFAPIKSRPPRNGIQIYYLKIAEMLHAEANNASTPSRIQNTLVPSGMTTDESRMPDQNHPHVKKSDLLLIRQMLCT